MAGTSCSQLVRPADKAGQGVGASGGRDARLQELSRMLERASRAGVGRGADADAQDVVDDDDDAAADADGPAPKPVSTRQGQGDGRLADGRLAAAGERAPLLPHPRPFPPPPHVAATTGSDYNETDSARWTRWFFEAYAANARYNEHLAWDLSAPSLAQPASNTTPPSTSLPPAASSSSAPLHAASFDEAPEAPLRHNDAETASASGGRSRWVRGTHSVEQLPGAGCGLGGGCVERLPVACSGSLLL